jgi:hypothetical protein
LSALTEALSITARSSDYRALPVDPAAAEDSQQPPVQLQPDPPAASNRGTDASRRSRWGIPVRPEHLPRHAALEDEDDPLQVGAVGDRRPPPFGEGLGSGRSGAVAFHNLFATRFLAIVSSPAIVRPDSQNVSAIEAKKHCREF